MHHMYVPLRWALYCPYLFIGWESHLGSCAMMPLRINQTSYVNRCQRRGVHLHLHGRGVPPKFLLTQRPYPTQGSIDVILSKDVSEAGPA